MYDARDRMKTMAITLSTRKLHTYIQTNVSARVVGSFVIVYERVKLAYEVTTNKNRIAITTFREFPYSHPKVVRCDSVG